MGRVMGLDRVVEDIDAVVAGLRGRGAELMSAGQLGRNLADARVAEVAGAGHMGPALVPEGVAGELDRFFSRVHTEAE